MQVGKIILDKQTLDEWKEKHWDLLKTKLTVHCISEVYDKLCTIQTLRHYEIICECNDFDEVEVDGPIENCDIPTYSANIVTSYPRSTESVYIKRYILYVTRIYDH